MRDLPLASALFDPDVLDEAFGVTGGILDDVVMLATDAVTQLSIEDEWRLGAEWANRVSEHVQIVDDTVRSRAIQQIVSRFAMHLERTRGQIYTVHIVEGADINAFAVAGGHLYFFTGLLDALESVSELQFVVGHEMAHVELAHSIQNAIIVEEAARIAGPEVASMVNQVRALVSMGYNQEREYASDGWSYDQMRAAGLEHEDCLGGARRMLRLLGPGEQSGHPRSDRDNDFVQRLLGVLRGRMASHPSWAARLTRLKARE